MANKSNLGLVLTIAATILVSCTQESVMGESSPQVTNPTISLTFFEQSMSDIGAGSRAGSTTPLLACHTFSELEVALIPVGKESEAGYVIRQDSLEEDFGKVSLQVPAGDYHLVAVAAKTKMPFTDRIDIKSTTEVRFPNNVPTDMVYVYKDIKVESSISKQSFNSAMTRGVAAFVLQATDYPTASVNSEEIEILGAGGSVFNPSTGTSKETEDIKRSIEIDGKRYQSSILHFTAYLFLKSADVENVEITSKIKDKDGKILKSLSFDDVHLVLGKKTTYTGKIFTNDNTLDFTVSNAQIEDSGYSKNF